MFFNGDNFHSIQNQLEILKPGMLMEPNLIYGKLLSKPGKKSWRMLLNGIALIS